MTEDTTKKTETDPDTLSDEDFMKLDVPPAEVVDPTKENDDEGDGTQSTAGDTANGNDQDGTGESGATGSGEGEDGTGEEAQLTDEEKAAAELVAKEEKEAADALLTDEEKETAAAAKLAEEAEANDKSEEDDSTNADRKILKLKDKDGKDIEPTKEEKEAAETAEIQAVSDDFFKKVSAPFKADGKDVQVRNPEEAIRLMQMGVNYSRRMQEMKPLREMDAMLTAHGLNDPAKLNELIDLSKGSKEAIQKHLKKHSIDPLDLDASKGDDHTTPNYQSDPKDVAFQDAIDITLQAEGGKELLADINRDWDEGSKEALRENPSIFGKLLEQKDTGVYTQIQKELLHQKTMGYLANVPLLQAYEQVGNAMKKAGVFNTTETSKKTGLAPIHSGSRKAAPKPKTGSPNPNLSSTSRTAKVPSKDEATQEPDYLSMSDDDFMKLASPG